LHLFAKSAEAAQAARMKGAVSMSFVDSLKKGLFGSEDEYDDQYIDDGPQMVNNNNGLGIGADDEDEDPAEGTPKKNKVVNIHATTQLKVVLVKPERFEDASTIADHLNNKRTVVLNLESTNKEVSRRLVDFLSGVAYANNGQIKRVANSTFIITPYNVDIMGDLLDELENNGAFY
jgi:cell division inhibitor SepF